ncbi:MAG: formylglycine-generating enzyme family protein [Xanthobacteraceae bacterium]
MRILSALACAVALLSVGVRAELAQTQSLSFSQKGSLKPRDVFKECDKCPEMVVVTPGSFTMGAPTSEADRNDNEGPRHWVKIAKPFAVGRYHVSVDQFSAFVTETGYDTGSRCWTFEDGVAEEREARSWRNPGFEQTGSHPAVCLSWSDAKAYVAWLAKKSGRDYRLLTEAQWEYVTRAGSTTPFWWGSSISTDQANYDGDFAYGRGSKGEYRRQTVPVDSFQPNGFGLYQVHGNAWQWVEDCWHKNYHGAPSDGSPWVSGTCDRRALRGGSWFNLPRDLRAAVRSGDAANVRLNIVGFRVAITSLTGVGATIPPAAH